MSFWDGVGDFLGKGYEGLQKFSGAKADYSGIEQRELPKGSVDYATYLQRSQGREAPQVQGANAGPAAQVQSAQFNPNAQGRDFQVALANRLQQQAQGNGPSLAQLAFQQNQDANIAAAQSQIASNSRGINSGLAARNVANAAASANMNAANQSAQLGMQERMNANQQLAGVASGLYGQDSSNAQIQAQLAQQAALANQGALNNQGQFNAQLLQQANLANAQNLLAQRGQNDAQLLGLAGQETQRDVAGNRAFMDYQQLLAQRALSAQQGQQKLFGGLLSGAGTALASPGGK